MATRPAPWPNAAGREALRVRSMDPQIVLIERTRQPRGEVDPKGVTSLAGPRLSTTRAERGSLKDSRSRSAPLTEPTTTPHIASTAGSPTPADRSSYAVTSSQVAGTVEGPSSDPKGQRFSRKRLDAAADAGALRLLLNGQQILPGGYVEEDPARA